MKLLTLNAICLSLLAYVGRRKFLLLGAFGMMVAIGAMGIALADVGVQKPVEILCNSANTASSVPRYVMPVLFDLFVVDVHINPQSGQ